MIALLLTPEYAPFTLAFCVMLGIGLLQAIGLSFEALGLHAGLDHDLDGHGPLEWLGISSGIPILVWLTSLLALFTLSGIALQQAITMLAGLPLQWIAASGVAGMVALPLNAVASRGLAHVLPKDETTAIPIDDLLMRRARITIGTARAGSAAQARVVDHFGQLHHVMVEPHDSADVFEAGETVTLLRRANGIFYAAPEQPTLFRPV